jgi:hypothetical protein
MSDDLSTRFAVQESRLDATKDRVDEIRSELGETSKMATAVDAELRRAKAWIIACAAGLTIVIGGSVLSMPGIATAAAKRVVANMGAAALLATIRRDSIAADSILKTTRSDGDTIARILADVRRRTPDIRALVWSPIACSGNGCGPGDNDAGVGGTPKPHYYTPGQLGIDTSAIILAAASNCYDNCYQAPRFSEADATKDDNGDRIVLWVASNTDARIRLHVTVLYYVPNLP